MARPATSACSRFWRTPQTRNTTKCWRGWAGQVDAPALVPVALAAVVTLGLGVRMLIEERFLTQTYPEYANYMKTAKRLIPFVF